MLVPVAWFYFGQDLKPAFLETALRLMVVLGVLTSLYGLYQLAFGFPAFEQYWLDHTEFYDSISVGNVKRALATYSSAEEWGRYIEIGAIIAFGFATCAGSFLRRACWFLSGAALTMMILLTGQRTAMFGLNPRMFSADGVGCAKLAQRGGTSVTRGRSSIASCSSGQGPYQ